MNSSGAYILMQWGKEMTRVWMGGMTGQVFILKIGFYDISQAGLNL